MMILPIVLVFALNMFDTHGHGCQLFDLSCQWDRLMKHLYDNCHCVRPHQCYLGDISEKGRCLNHFNEVDPDYVCCRNPVRLTTVRPPPRRPTEFPAQLPSFLDGGPNKRPGGPNKRPGGPNKRPGGPNKRPGGPNKRPSQKPEATTHGPPKTSTKVPTGVPPSQPPTHVPSRTSTQRPINNPSTQTRPSSSQPQDTEQNSLSTNTDCMHTCMPLKDCNDNDEQEGSCPNPNDVCCLGLDHPLDPSLQPLSPSPAQESPSTDQNYTCNGTCTPFFKCYDEETSSNLTGLVNDRNTIPDGCSDPNDVCCYNLFKITTKPAKLEPSPEDCTGGSCISIHDCPYHLIKLKEAQGGNSDAVQELRKSVCSNTNGTLHVCCPPPPPPCQFPFIYKSATYSGCTTVDDPDGKPWCSTETDDQNNHVKDQYRLCTTDDTPRAAQN